MVREKDKRILEREEEYWHCLNERETSRHNITTGKYVWKKVRKTHQDSVLPLYL